MVSLKTLFTEFWKNFRQTNLQGRRVIIACITILASILIGVRYANEPYIHITPIIIWVYSILICFAALYPTQKSALFEYKFNRARLGLLGLLAIAFFLRIVNLADSPPGFHPDEAGSVEFALLNIFPPDLNWMTINPLRTGLDSQPVFYSYILRLSMALFGFTMKGARMSSVIAGTLSIAGIFLMVTETAGRKTAWLAAILMTVYHYHIHWSRVALSNIWVTLLLPLALGLFLRGWRKGQESGALLAGLCLGLTAYLYTGGYILVFLLAIIIWQTWWAAEDRIRLTVYIGKMLAIATVTAAPLIVFSLIKPDHFFDRVNTIFGWGTGTAALTLGGTASQWDYFVYQFTRSFGAYNIYTDVTGFYAPEIPFLIGVSSLLFLVGIALSVWRKQFLPVAWVILVTILGGAMMIGTPASSHFIPVIPAICWLVAIPIQQVSESKRPYWAYLLLAAVIIVDLSFYFAVYSASPHGDFTVPFPSVPLH